MPDGQLPSLYLASQSPRRRQILENLGLAFRVLTPEENETHPNASDIDEVARTNAERKASAVLESLPAGDSVVIGADTLVLAGNRVLGKPKDSTDAQKMLELLSGSAHTVVTGIALLSPQHGTRSSSVRTEVRFRKLSPHEIQDYLKTREPYDKAGAYGVQGMAALFIEGMAGSYTNVMGLPVEQLLLDLSALTAIPVWRWFRK